VSLIQVKFAPVSPVDVADTAEELAGRFLLDRDSLSSASRRWCLLEKGSEKLVPGYAEYLDIESAVKILNNMLPDANDRSEETWQPLSEIAQKLDQHADSLVAATAGRSQQPRANELKEITAQLVRAISRIIDESADEGGVATTRGAIRNLPGFLEGFDQERLQRS
jgi:hypothetical protein